VAEKQKMVRIPESLYQRAEKLTEAMKEWPQYRHVDLPVSAVLRMAVEWGLEGLEGQDRKYKED